MSLPTPLPLPAGPFHGTRKEYYVNHFPFAAVYELVGGPNREIAFVDGEGHWTRYLSFPSAYAMREAAIQREPNTIHIAGGYASGTAPAGGIQPAFRELVFDVDIDKFTLARARCCGEKKQACAQCWRFARLAMKLMRLLLEEIFGYKKILFVFSGGRGFHVWVLDPEAAHLAPNQRSHLLSFFMLSNVNAPHPCIDVLYQQVILPFAHAELRDVPDIAHALDNLPEPARRTVLLNYTWPRLDDKVSRFLNHALKIPFGLHASTNQVCYVLNEHRDDPFNPARAPDMQSSLETFYSVIRG